MRKKFASQGDLLVRVKPKEIVAAGVERVARTVGVKDGSPVLDDGRMLEVSNVIWCTGYRHDLSWIDLPIFGEDGEPLHHRGVVPTEQGLYFVGLPFQYSATSDTLPGVGRDAEYVARQLVTRQRSRGPKQEVALAAARVWTPDRANLRRFGAETARGLDAETIVSTRMTASERSGRFRIMPSNSPRPIRTVRTSPWATE